MLIKIAALVTLAYGGFKVLRSATRRRVPSVISPSELRMAGGPLSKNATVQRTADGPMGNPKFS